MKVEEIARIIGLIMINIGLGFGMAQIDAFGLFYYLWWIAAMSSNYMIIEVTRVRDMKDRSQK